MWRYHNPVGIMFGQGGFAELPRLVDGRSYALVTYPDTPFAHLAERLTSISGKPTVVIDDVAPNPDYELLERQVARCAAVDRAPEVIVALGGGSVIDTAKVLSAADGDFAAVRNFLETKTGGDQLGAVPIIAVPTTSGTGSEVTCWGTVWDQGNGVKHSLARPDLYPELALIDPELMLGKPRDLTVSTGLDTLSHALESLWNKNANPVSTTFAISAAREIIDVLPRLVEALDDLELRTRVARAALLAGLAFSNTKTAIAHSLSYPITLRHGVPHGIACSFTLPMIMRSIAGSGAPAADALRAIFDAEPVAGADMLDGFLDRLGVATSPAEYGIQDQEWRSLVAAALDGERGQNFNGSPADLMRAMLGREEAHPLPTG